MSALSRCFLAEGCLLISKAGCGNLIATYDFPLCPDEWECVTRYDCVHGFPHRDVIGKESGLLYKQTFRGLTLEQVFRYAIHDCQKNYERHIRFFQAH
jgi:hypothetical protein